MVRRDALLHKFVIATEDVPAHRRDARSLTQSLEVERHPFDRGSSCRVVRVDVRLEVIEYGFRVEQVERIPFADSEEGHLEERHNPGGVTVEIPTTVLVEDFFSSPRHGPDSDRIPRCRQHHVRLRKSSRVLVRGRITSLAPVFEPLRECCRLQSLRGWSHVRDVEEVFTGGS